MILFDVSSPTVYRIRHDASAALRTLFLMRGIPTTEDSRRASAAWFVRSRAFLNSLACCVGSIYRIVIKIDKMSEEEEPAQ